MEKVVFKNLSRLGLVATIAALTLFSCADKSTPPPSGNAPTVDVPDDGPYVPPGSGPGLGPGSNWEHGATAKLKLESLQAFEDYTQRTMNDPEDLRININLLKYGKGYGGTVTIGYKDNTGFGDSYFEGYFTSGTSQKEVQYNIFFTDEGKIVWHGFFEDFLGGLIVVLDSVTNPDLGDGQGAGDKMNGSIWYKNFGLTYAPHPPTRCWFVSIGPYDCRAWKKNDGVKTTKAVYPDSNYQKLGEFSGLSLEDAFNGEATL